MIRDDMTNRTVKDTSDGSSVNERSVQTPSVDYKPSRGKISEKQSAILAYIRSELISKGYPPAVREICAAVGLKSPATVHAHLHTLEENGYIRRDPSKNRAIEIIDEEYAVPRHDSSGANVYEAGREYAQIPILGYVAAGEPLFAEQHIEDFFPLPADILPNTPVFMLQVRGDSMINAGILDGDKVIVKQTKDISDGEIAVALIEEGATVKTFYKEKDHIRLQPENPDYDPIIVRDVEILGQVIGVFRMF